MPVTAQLIGHTVGTSLGNTPVRVEVSPLAGLTTFVIDSLPQRERGVAPAWRTLARRLTTQHEVMTPFAHGGTVTIPGPIAPMTGESLLDGLDRIRSIHPDELVAAIARSSDGTIPPHWQCAAAKPRSWTQDYAAMLAAVWHGGYAEIWRRAGPLIDRETGRIGQALVTGAFPELIAGVHPQLRLCDGLLEVQGQDRTYTPTPGGTLHLAPLVAGTKSLAYATSDESSTIGFPLRGLGLLWERDRPTASGGQDRLAALLGRRRAIVMRELLSQSMYAGELAAASDCTPSAVTYHSQLLVDAGLVTRERRGKHVLFALTERGHRLADLYRAQ